MNNLVVTSIWGCYVVTGVRGGRGSSSLSYLQRGACLSLGPTSCTWCCMDSLLRNSLEGWSNFEMSVFCRVTIVMLVGLGGDRDKGWRRRDMCKVNGGKCRRSHGEDLNDMQMPNVSERAKAEGRIKEKGFSFHDFYMRHPHSLLTFRNTCQISSRMI